jgi:hypothetical protein
MKMPRRYFNPEFIPWLVRFSAVVKLAGHDFGATDVERVLDDGTLKLGVRHPASVSVLTDQDVFGSDEDLDVLVTCLG